MQYAVVMRSRRLSPVLVLALLAPFAAAEDARRVGTVLDRQGTALVRPAGRDRWSPLEQGAALLAGDTVRTPLHGAHAVECGLAGGGAFVLGPGARVGIRDGGVRLYAGEVEASGGIAVEGSGGFSRTLDRGVVRATATVAPPRPRGPAR